MYSLQVQIALLEEYHLLILLFLQSLQIVMERLCLTKYPLLFQKVIKLHRLGQISHPLLTKITILKAKVNRFIYQLQTEKKQFLLAIATYLDDLVDGEWFLYLVVSLTWIEI